jgi:hypothetical protein
MNISKSDSNEMVKLVRHNRKSLIEGEGNIV